MSSKFEFIKDDINHKYRMLLDDLKARKLLITRNKIEPQFKDLVYEMDTLGDTPINQLFTHYKIYIDDHIANYESMEEKFEKYVEELNVLAEDMIKELKKQPVGKKVPRFEPELIQAATPIIEQEPEDEDMEEQQPTIENVEPAKLRLPGEPIVRKVRRPSKTEKQQMILSVYKALPVQDRTYYRIAKETGISADTVRNYMRKMNLVTMGVRCQKGTKRDLELSVRQKSTEKADDDEFQTTENEQPPKANNS